MIRYQKTKNTLRNTSSGLVLKFINIVGAFAARTMLIYILGVEYVGLDGLFTSILTMLNMAELGFSSAVVFKLYRPIAENQTELVCSLINYYKKVYRIIGIVVLGIGVAIIPFLKFIVNSDTPENINIYILYLIYLFNTCLSYWLFAYKTILLTAHQRNDLVSKVTSVVFVGKYIFQFLVLIFLRNYYAYAIVIPITTVATNIGCALIARHYYPQYVCKGQILDADRKEIKDKISALIYNKIGVAIINGSDNIVISSFLGLTVLGVYDSYYYVFNMLHSIFDVFHSAITGGIGNSIITDSKDKNYDLFEKLCFINSWIVGVCSICMLCLYEPFITLWIGEGKAFSPWFSVIMAAYFYIWMIRFITLVFKNAQGLWREDRFRAIIEGALNLCLNLIMVQFMGIYGITLSTIIAMIVVSIPWETKVLFKCYFNKSTKTYYFKLITRFITTVVSGGIIYSICMLVKGPLILQIVIKGLICVIFSNIIFWGIFRNNDNFKYAVGKAKNYIMKYRGR